MGLEEKALRDVSDMAEFPHYSERMWLLLSEPLDGNWPDTQPCPLLFALFWCHREDAKLVKQPAEDWIPLALRNPQLV